jgi:YD repeat-containing protein
MARSQSSYTSAMIGGMWVPLAVQGSGCSTCTIRGSVAYTYDLTGRVLTRTDENGNTTSYTYDLQGDVLTATVPTSPGHTAYRYVSNNPTDPRAITRFDPASQ